MSDVGIDLGPNNATGALNAIMTALDTLDGDAGDGIGLLASLLLYHISASSQSVAKIGVAGEVDPIAGRTFDVTANGTIIDAESALPNAGLVDGATDLGA